MKQNAKNARAGKVRKTRETRAMLASRFRVLCADAGLSIDAVAQTLHVTPRTVRYWFSGKSGVPYSAYKLVRVLRWFELPQKGFEGWCMHSGKLWTPEGHPIGPEDGGWWSLLVRQARCFRALYQRSGDLERALMMLTSRGLMASDAPASSSLNLAIAEAAPSGERLAVAAGGESASPARKAGRREAPLDLSLGHFGTNEQRNAGSRPVQAVRVSSEVAYER